MSVSVFIGYKDENNGYEGFVGAVTDEEYELLKRLSERCNDPGLLSIEELKAISDIKDSIVKAWMKIHETSKELESENQVLDTVERALGQAIEAFDAYNVKAPQLAFLLVFCIIDAKYFQRDEGFDAISFDYEEAFILELPIEDGAIKHIAMSEELTWAVEEWIDLDGRRLMDEAFFSEDDEDAMESEFEWWKENIRYFEELVEYDLTTMLFRALRNNEMKCIRTGKQVLSSIEWVKRIEIL